MDGEFNARRLRDFTPRPGTELAKAQQDFEERLANEAAPQEPSQASPPAPEASLAPNAPSIDNATEEATHDMTENAAPEIAATPDNERGRCRSSEEAELGRGMDEEEDEAEDEEETDGKGEEEGIGERVARRRRGRRQKDSGQMD